MITTCDVDNSSFKISGMFPNFSLEIRTKLRMPENSAKSLAELQKEADDIQLKIRRLLLNNYSYDDGIADQLTKIAVVADLRRKFIALEREIRLRSEGE